MWRHLTASRGISRVLASRTRKPGGWAPPPGDVLGAEPVALLSERRGTGCSVCIPATQPPYGEILLAGATGLCRFALPQSSEDGDEAVAVLGIPATLPPDGEILLEGALLFLQDGRLLGRGPRGNTSNRVQSSDLSKNPHLLGSITLAKQHWCHQRWYSTSSSSRDRFEPLPPPPVPPSPAELLSVEKRCETSSLLPFDVHMGDSMEAKAAVELYKKTCSGDLAVDRLKQIYYSTVEAALVIRGLLSPFLVSDERSHKLHHEYKKILGREYPIYMTLYGLMEKLDSMIGDDWLPLLDYLSHQKVIILNDWTPGGSSFAGYSRFDYGARWAPYVDSPDYYKGETDASFHKLNDKEGEAHLCNIIMQRDQIIDCRIYYNYRCADSIEAEATGMLLLQKRAKQLGIKNFQAYTDNRLIQEVIGGMHRDHPKHKNLFAAIRRMVGSFDIFTGCWANREKLTFADGLMRRKFGYDNTFPMESVLWEWAPHLNGSRIFNLTGRTKSDHIDLLGQEEDYFTDTELEHCCYIEVADNTKKIEGLLHALVALRPGEDLLIVTKDSSSAPEIKNQIASLYSYKCSIFDCITTQTCSLLTLSVGGMGSYKRLKRSLLVVMDASLLKETVSVYKAFPGLEKKDLFTVFISTTCEKYIMNEFKLPSQSPLSFVSYHRARKSLEKKTKASSSNGACIK